MSKIFFFALLIICFSCEIKKDTDIGEVYLSDRDCISEIKKAQKDFSAGKKNYFPIYGMAGKLDYESKLVENLKKIGIKTKTAHVIDIIDEKQRQVCYEKQMNFLISQEIGKEELQRILDHSKVKYYHENHLKIKIDNGAEEIIVDSVQNKDLINYPKGYVFSKLQKEISYYQLYFTVSNNKLVFIEPFEYKIDQESNHYQSNLIFEQDFNKQIQEKLIPEIKTLKLKDNQYSVMYIMK